MDFDVQAILLAYLLRHTFALDQITITYRPGDCRNKVPDGLGKSTLPAVSSPILAFSVHPRLMPLKYHNQHLPSRTGEKLEAAKTRRPGWFLHITHWTARSVFVALAAAS